MRRRKEQASIDLTALSAAELALPVRLVESGGLRPAEPLSEEHAIEGEASELVLQTKA